MPKTIHIDDEVWKELQKRGEPFIDTPNTVIKRLLGLDDSQQINKEDQKMDILNDPRIKALIDKVSSAYEKQSIVNRGYALAFKVGSRAIAYVYPQKKQIKLEADKSIVEKLGLSNWEHELKGGWWDTADTVYWYAPNGDDKAISKLAGVLIKMNKVSL